MIIPNVPLATDLQLVQYGKECESRASDSGKNFRWYYLIHLIAKGTGTYTIGEQTYRLRAGQIFLIPPGKTVWYGMDTDYEYYWVGFKGGDAKKFVQTSVFKDTYVTDAHFSDALAFVKQLTELKKYNAKSNRAKLSCLLAFLSSLSIEDTDDGEELYTDGKDLTETALRYVEQNYQTVTVQSLADAVRLSRSELYRVFMRNVGVAPRQYIINYRLDESLFMVEQTNIKITDIAAICGLYDNNSFTKLFKRKFGRPPSDVRRRPINTKYAPLKLNER